MINKYRQKAHLTKNLFYGKIEEAVLHDSSKLYSQIVVSDRLDIDGSMKLTDHSDGIMAMRMATSIFH